jgi:peptidoglycan hydrolase-like protein with peptidoglycan-binding domain
MPFLRITNSVGAGGVNRPEDVKTVQALLNAALPEAGLDIDGHAGPLTIAAIKQFQSTLIRTPDGRVDPEGRTLNELNIAAGKRASKTYVWTGDAEKWPYDQKLASLEPAFAKQVAAILDELSGRGFQPKLFFAWRSVEKQLELVKAGHSKVKFSFHNARAPDGTPRALAADIVDQRWYWDKVAETKGFWAALGQAATARGLVWGGSWTKFPDAAHIQALPNSELARIRRESGQD